MRGRIVGTLVFVAVCVYRLTLSIRLVGRENRDAIEARGKPVLHAIWHQRMVLGILRFAYSGTFTMASLSGDGDIIATFLALWGFRAVRGSSSRGGAEALNELTDALANPSGRPAGRRWAALTPDGPRGPARRAKPGLARLAEALDAPVLPVGSSATRPIFLRSWDRYLVPRPFSRCVVVFGPPVERVAGEGDLELLARIDAAIDEATAEADRLCGVAHAPREREARGAGA